MSAAATVDVERWADEIDRVRVRLGPLFTRSEVRVRVGTYLQGLLAGVDRKNGWQLAEFAGDLSPANVQHFIGRAAWDADAVRDDLRGYVVENLGEPDGVLIGDETGFLKKGDKSVAVQRQCCGTAGRIENSQAVSGRLCRLCIQPTGVDNVVCWSGGRWPTRRSGRST